MPLPLICSNCKYEHQVYWGEQGVEQFWIAGAVIFSPNGTR